MDEVVHPLLVSEVGLGLRELVVVVWETQILSTSVNIWRKELVQGKETEWRKERREDGVVWGYKSSTRVNIQEGSKMEGERKGGEKSAQGSHSQGWFPQASSLLRSFCHFPSPLFSSLLYYLTCRQEYHWPSQSTQCAIQDVQCPRGIPTRALLLWTSSTRRNPTLIFCLLLQHSRILY